MPSIAALVFLKSIVQNARISVGAQFQIVHKSYLFCHHGARTASFLDVTTNAHETQPVQHCLLLTCQL